MNEAAMEAAAEGVSFGMFRAMYPGVEPEYLQRIHWRVRSRAKRVRSTVTFVAPPELIADLATMLNHMVSEKHGIPRWRVIDLRKRHGIKSPTHLFPEIYTAGAARRTKPMGFDKALDSQNYHNWVNRDTSLAGQAADYLRRFGPVVRCDDRGRYNENGTHWRRNFSVLTADEIIERAEANGFDSRAWARLAA